jgi:alkanesulfonate monooxygenase SsuD/methylene tetrahydromethanopterin reductase-like flavin-dependent oxidoreductase (luciferase family)
VKFGLFFEHQVPRPWDADADRRVLAEALEQVELADRLGFDHVWAVEHHFLEEYAHSAAPELFLAAASQRTRHIRLGHGIVLAPPAYNHPARVAERLATLDVLSGGRVDFGAGESGSRTELEGFDVDPREKRLMWRECFEQICEMLARDPYPGFEGRYFRMPVRNVVPKPIQRPHPPLWMACPKRDTLRLAAAHGVGALTFSFLTPEEARGWIDDYYTTYAEECIPIGHTTNPEVALVAPLAIAPDRATAHAQSDEHFQFFRWSMGHYYDFGRHRPGVTDVWASFQAARPRLGGLAAPGVEVPGFGTPDDLVRQLEGFEAAGADQITFLAAYGKKPHAEVMAGLELFGHEVLPRFRAREEARAQAKAERLAEATRAALARKRVAPALAPEQIPEHWALGRGLMPGESLPPLDAAVAAAMASSTSHRPATFSRPEGVVATLFGRPRRAAAPRAATPALPSPSRARRPRAPK